MKVAESIYAANRAEIKWLPDLDILEGGFSLTASLDCGLRKYGLEIVVELRLIAAFYNSAKVWVSYG